MTNCPSQSSANHQTLCLHLIHFTITQHPAIYSGDFNCHHRAGSTRGRSGRGSNWSSTVDLMLFYDPNQSNTFQSVVCNAITNSNLSLLVWSKQCHNVVPTSPNADLTPSIDWVHQQLPYLAGILAKLTGEAFVNLPEGDKLSYQNPKG